MNRSECDLWRDKEWLHYVRKNCDCVVCRGEDGEVEGGDAERGKAATDSRKDRLSTVKAPR